MDASGKVRYLMVGMLDDRKGIQAVTLAGSALHGELNACVLPPSWRHNNGHKKNIFSLLQGNRKTLESKCEKTRQLSRSDNSIDRSVLNIISCHTSFATSIKLVW